MDKDHCIFNEQDLISAWQALSSGGAILYPTDTVWGIGCDARDDDAVSRVFAIKGREESKSLISLVDSIEMLRQYVSFIPPQAETLMLEEGKRPVTVIFEGVKGLAAKVVASDGSAAFRLTREAFSSALCKKLGTPLVSTSANISGAVSASTFNSIDAQIIEKMDYVVKYRQDDMTESTPSKIVKISADGTIIVIRP